MSDLAEPGNTGARSELPLGELLRPGEVAVMLGVSRSWLYEAATPLTQDKALNLAHGLPVLF